MRHMPGAASQPKRRRAGRSAIPYRCVQPCRPDTIGSPNPMSTPAYSWVLVGLLSIMAFLNYLDRQAIFSMFPLLQSELKLTNVQLGLLSAAFLWIYGLLSPVAGFIADRFGRR